MFNTVTTSKICRFNVSVVEFWNILCLFILLVQKSSKAFEYIEKDAKSIKNIAIFLNVTLAVSKYATIIYG